jgi:hypothetical protein
MRRTHTRTAAAVTALAAGGLAAFALRPTNKPTLAIAARDPVVEVRTQVIRRTIHIIRHEPAAQFPVPRERRGFREGARARTGASGSHHASAAAATTRTSGAHTSYSGGSVATRTSGSHAGSGSGSSSTSRPTTRTSGSHTGGGSSGPTTRTSGGGERGDGRDGSRGRDN